MEGKQIFELIPKIMREVGAIGKDRKNQMQGYNFRGIDDVYNAINGPLSANGVFAVPSVVNMQREETQDLQRRHAHLYDPDGQAHVLCSRRQQLRGRDDRRGNG